MMIKIFNFLSKITTACKLWLEKFLFLWSWKRSFFWFFNQIKSFILTLHLSVYNLFIFFCLIYFQTLSIFSDFHKSKYKHFYDQKGLELLGSNFASYSYFNLKLKILVFVFFLFFCFQLYFFLFSHYFWF